MINLNNSIVFKKFNVSSKEDLMGILVYIPIMVKEGIKIKGENLIRGLNEK